MRWETKHRTPKAHADKQAEKQAKARATSRMLVAARMVSGGILCFDYPSTSIAQDELYSSLCRACGGTGRVVDPLHNPPGSTYSTTMTRSCVCDQSR